MKKLFIVFGIVCLVSSSTLFAKSSYDFLPIIKSQSEMNLFQNDLVTMTNLIQETEVEIKILLLNEDEPAKECRMTVKGTIDGKEVDVVIVIEGQSCAEFFKELL